MGRQYNNELVSVIMPTYNLEKYIKRTLESALRQTYEKIEIVIVDDRSTDRTTYIIEELQKEYPQIVCYSQEKNMGAGAARNKALELAKGRYVAFLDGDDFWKPQKIELQLKLMKEKACPFSYTAIEMIDEDDKLIKPKRKIKEKCNYKYLLTNTIIATSSVVIDREVLGDFRMPLRRGGQDYATWLELLRDGTMAYGINEALVQYRISSDSLSSNKLKSIKQVWEIQTQDEGIGKGAAIFHVCSFAFHAIKKYFI